MNSAKLVAGTLAVAALLGMTLVGFVMAETPSPSAHSALTGKVASQAEGPMEGVIVGAKKAGSPITTWVVSDAQGQYSFPRDRMEPGKYAIKIRAVGYELPNTSADVTAEPTQLDLQLNKVTSTSKLANQLSNGELLTSVPGSHEEKMALGGCVNCHTLQRVLFSRYSAEELAPVVQRMAMHTNNSSPLHPWTRPPRPATAPTEMQIVRFDPKTEKMETFKPPIADSDIGDGHLTMIDPSYQQVDGKIWVNVADGTDESGGTWHVDLATNTWTHVTYPPGSPSARAYDVVADSKNNMYGMSFGNDKIWMTDGKTLKTVWYDLPTKGAGCRRGHIDSQDRLWCGEFNGNGLAMFDPKTQKITEWKAPTPWTRPYDAEFDDKAYDWGAGMDNDIALRLNTQTGEFTEYLLPHETNVRHVEVQKSGALSSLWLGDQHGATIIHVEPLAP